MAAAAQPYSLPGGSGKGGCQHKGEQPRWLPSPPHTDDWLKAACLVAPPLSTNYQWGAGPHDAEPSPPIDGEGVGSYDRQAT